MATHNLTEASPGGDEFTLTEETSVQFVVLPESTMSNNEIVTLQVEKEAPATIEFTSYGIAFPKGKTLDVVLKPNKYRLYVSNTEASTNINVQLSPIS